MDDTKGRAKVTAVLRKLQVRRGSKDSGLANASRNPSVATLPSPPVALVEGKCTFFDLPPELRNEIYDLIASNTVLTLPSPEQRSKKLNGDIVPIHGLLLVSRQCRREFLPVLYSTAPVIVDIKDFDFQNLLRVIGGLYSMELKALRENRHLLIRLLTCNCTRENLQSLRRWLVSRADSLDRLPWQYEVKLSDPAGRIGCFRQSRELAYYGHKLARLQLHLEDTLQWELQAIIAAFESKGKELDHVLQGLEKPRLMAGPNAYGLSGGGLR